MEIATSSLAVSALGLPLCGYSDLGSAVVIAFGQLSAHVHAGSIPDIHRLEAGVIPGSIFGTTMPFLFWSFAVSAFGSAALYLANEVCRRSRQGHGGPVAEHLDRAEADRVVGGRATVLALSSSGPAGGRWLRDALACRDDSVAVRRVSRAVAQRVSIGACLALD